MDVISLLSHPAVALALFTTFVAVMIFALWARNLHRYHPRFRRVHDSDEDEDIQEGDLDVCNIDAGMEDVIMDCTYATGRTLGEDMRRETVSLDGKLGDCQHSQQYRWHSLWDDLMADDSTYEGASAPCAENSTTMSPDQILEWNEAVKEAQDSSSWRTLRKMSLPNGAAAEARTSHVTSRQVGNAHHDTTSTTTTSKSTATVSNRQTPANPALQAYRHDSGVDNEELLYVNAKQYRRILVRRKARQQLEAYLRNWHARLKEGKRDVQKLEGAERPEHVNGE